MSDKPSSQISGLPELDKALGLVVDEVGRDQVRAHLPVTSMALQPFGIVHGGVYAAIAESLASYGGHMRVLEDGHRALGSSNSTSFLRPLSEGTIHAVATIRHAGRTTHVWDTEFTNDDGKLCAISRVTLAIR